MAHNSTENLIQSDSSASTDELNNASRSRSVEKVSKKMFRKKKTAFVGANSVTTPSSSVTSSPQHPIIVVGTADVHQPPKPFPRKQLMMSVESTASNGNHFTRADDSLDISVSDKTELNNTAGKIVVVNREDIELTEIKSESSGAQSDRTVEPKMFFARSRKNTIVTNIDEVSIKSSSRTNKSSEKEVKPLPKPRRNIQPQYEIVHEKSSKKHPSQTSEQHSNSDDLSHSKQSKSSFSGSETFTDSELSDSEKHKATKVDSKERIDLGTATQQDNLINKLIGKFAVCFLWYTSMWTSFATSLCSCLLQGYTFIPVVN